MTKIKICGLRRLQDVEYVNTWRPDMIGFIFDPARRRYIPPETAAELRRALAPGILAAGVFVDAEADLIRDIAALAGLDWIQLHGRESGEDVLRVKELTGLPVIRAFSADSPAVMEKALASPADLVLLDNGPGGTGSAFDWTLIRDFPRPFILAGGLGPDNAAEAIARTSPFALDASSGLETDGWKDPEKIRRFIQTVRSLKSP